MRENNDDLAVRLSELARDLEDLDDVDETLRGIVHAAVGTIPGAEMAGIMVVERRRRVTTRAATDELVYRVDQLQYEVDDGPCLDSARDTRSVHRVDDLPAERRWPRFITRASPMGIGSMLSFQLFVVSDTLGSLTVYAHQPHAFDDESEHVGRLFATHAAVAMAEAREQEQLTEALTARDVIGQAKGILMERYKLTADQAFRLLTRVSQQTNRRLADIAHELATTGEVPARR